LIHATGGLVLVTGPTGSGKSSTLHASLSRLAQTGRKVITIEDPVERELPRVVQVGVRADLGLGFPEALRAVLRQSPEVIAVGEVRDRETARSCLNASLTGHLVFSTVHTADAVGAIVRLRDLGLPPSLLASALRGVVAQRLVRRVCRSCADAPTTVFAAESCAACCGTGFSGRVAVVELLVVDDALRALIRRDAGADALRTAARAAGMRTLAEDGRARVQDGLTTADELSRVLGPTLS
jgi:type II secretory ATPase GspE/PulE/Tfp pilus assembly ATPase PilB-like protein